MFKLQNNISNNGLQMKQHILSKSFNKVAAALNGLQFRVTYKSFYNKNVFNGKNVSLNINEKLKL